MTDGDRGTNFGEKDSEQGEEGARYSGEQGV